MSGSSDKNCNQIIGWLMSGVVHMAVLLLLLGCGAPSRFESLVEPEALVTPMLDSGPAEPMTSEPAPEPPAPEPPAPEPPAPEPPAPEPPAPEPPKPVPVPTPEPPKPVPTPEPPKQEPPKPRSIAERFRDAKTQKGPVKPPKTQKNPSPYVPKASSELEKSLAGSRTSGKPKAWATDSNSGRLAAPSRAMQSSNYAETIVKPYMYELWKTPAVGDSRPSPVTVEMDVDEEGRVSNIKITKSSNDERMNDSVRQLLRQVRNLTAFKNAGVTYRSLHIVVVMEIVN